MPRLRGLLRRVGAEDTAPTTRCRCWETWCSPGRPARCTATAPPVRLTAKEFDLLSPLLSHPRRALGKAQILDHVWSGCFDGGGNLVEAYISGLRRKIDKGRAPTIHTLRGVGYAIRPPEAGR